jgi:hypothetical protein
MISRELIRALAAFVAIVESSAALSAPTASIERQSAPIDYAHAVNERSSRLADRDQLGREALLEARLSAMYADQVARTTARQARNSLSFIRSMVRVRNTRSRAH